jgi:hypothetical protein
MKKSTIFLLIFLAIFFTSTLYLLYLNFLKPTTTIFTPQTGIIPTESSIPTAIPTSNSTADWKTYEDKKAGFSIKYPKDWKLSVGDIAGLISPIKSAGVREDGTPLFYSVDFEIIDESLNSWITSRGISDLKFINSTVNGYKFHATTELGDMGTNYSVLIENPSGKQIIYVNLSPYFATPEFQKVKETFNQILSTFKFTNQTQVPPAAIKDLFNSLNQLFGSSIMPTQVNTFIDNYQETTQSAWKLDLNSVVKDKPDWTNIIHLIEDQLKYKATGGADGTDGGYTFYESNLLKCDYNLFTNDKSFVCIEK